MKRESAVLFGCSVTFSRPAISSGDVTSDDDESATKSIIVRGFTSPPSEESLRLLFKNAKKTGGGEIESLKISKDKKSAQIIFKDEQGTTLRVYLTINFHLLITDNL